jgi:plastocyanin domain-containing protein
MNDITRRPGGVGRRHSLESGFVWGLMAVALAAGCSSQTGKDAAGGSRIAITVTDKGFEPEVVTVAAGKPVTLVVTRQSTQTCATDLIMPAYGINKPLPLGQAVEITFTPTKPGELTYACAMDMFKGKVIVK